MNEISRISVLNIVYSTINIIAGVLILAIDFSLDHLLQEWGGVVNVGFGRGQMIIAVASCIWIFISLVVLVWSAILFIQYRNLFDYD